MPKSCKLLPDTVLALTLTALAGCSSTPALSPGTGYRAPAGVYSLPPIKTTSTVTAARNFHQNDPDGTRAYFGLFAIDCRINGQPGVFVYKLNGDSVLRQHGVAVADQIIAMGPHRPANTAELTYIIQRITQETLVPLTLQRGGRQFTRPVVPPGWLPTPSQKAKIAAPYDGAADRCAEIGLQK